MGRLPTTSPLPAAYLVPALAAVVAGAVMSSVADAPVATQRSLVFLCGPLLLLFGLHARLFAFLHAPTRQRWLSLPIVPRRHWQAAARLHGPAFAWAAVLGALALHLALPSRPVARGVAGDTALTLEFCWFALIAWLLEPAASASAAFFGRRFADGSRGRELQRALGGGWTTPEAVVHLYAPALFVGLAVLLAMPGQLIGERWLDGHALDAGTVAIGASPLFVALALRVVSPAPYRVGLWEAVPWLAEATRTLAGPPCPEPTPRWVGWIRDPSARLITIEFLRMTPLPHVRVCLVIGLLIHTVIRATDPGGAAIALSMAAIGLWVVPVGTLVRARDARARMSAALPLSKGARSGKAGWITRMLFVTPALALITAIVTRLAI